jgi:hypothetical protein
MPADRVDLRQRLIRLTQLANDLLKRMPPCPP